MSTFIVDGPKLLRKGEIGDWKNYFTPEIEKHFESEGMKELMDTGLTFDLWLLNHPFETRGGVGDLTLTPVKRHQYPYPLRLEFRSNAPTTEATKMKILNFQEKKTCI